MKTLIVDCDGVLTNVLANRTAPWPGAFGTVAGLDACLTAK